MKVKCKTCGELYWPWFYRDSGRCEPCRTGERESLKQKEEHEARLKESLRAARNEIFEEAKYRES